MNDNESPESIVSEESVVAEAETSEVDEPVAAEPEESPLQDSDLDESAPVAAVEESVVAIELVPAAAPARRQPSESIVRMVAWLASRNVEKAEARDMGGRTWCITALFGGAPDFPEGAEIIRSELAPAYVRTFAIETPMMSRVVAETVEGVERLRIEFLAVEVG